MKINYTIFKNNVLLKNISCVIFLLVTTFSIDAQEASKEKQRAIKEAKVSLSEASYELENDNFNFAEAAYREAIALNPKEATGKYNLGNAYYNKKLNDVAMSRYKQAAAVAKTKSDKHSAFHNLGNTYMNEKKYQEAVESYKNALRNNSKDDETRYNYALAKELLEDQEKNGGGDDDKENEEEDNKEDKKENQDNENNKKDGEDGDQKDENDEGEKEQDKKEGDDKKDKGNPDEPKEEQQEQQKTEPGKLSPQQVKNLLEAMNNEEKKVQDKINAKKQKGKKIKSQKDW
ncbi:tetratricopeptide repeat protein [Flavobacteriaceae bacterium]|jgi:Ca-activated chloride channel family protein|nr:tetratricopeptide repeat protein [Flavobacteriaceae bacterium]MDB9993233.1 tetratricopeptide repeat protein [Flavobacteriaceae bacterium]MDC0538861.1 tetratricopeptide repeat protein [Flavobacteriaceae bacterium]